MNVAFEVAIQERIEPEGAKITCPMKRVRHAPGFALDRPRDRVVDILSKRRRQPLPVLVALLLDEPPEPYGSITRDHPMHAELTDDRDIRLDLHAPLCRYGGPHERTIGLTHLACRDTPLTTPGHPEGALHSPLPRQRGYHREQRFGSMELGDERRADERLPERCTEGATIDEPQDVLRRMRLGLRARTLEQSHRT